MGCERIQRNQETIPRPKSGLSKADGAAELMVFRGYAVADHAFLKTAIFMCAFPFQFGFRFTTEFLCGRVETFRSGPATHRARARRQCLRLGQRRALHSHRPCLS
jgi:hypothetical protein